MESIAQLRTERDCYAEQIQEEGRVWKDKTEQLLTQVNYALASAETLWFTAVFKIKRVVCYLLLFFILVSNK